VGGVADPIDLGVAVATARRLMPAGPALSPSEAAEAVEELRTLAVAAEGHVREFTGLAAGETPPPATVVDRPTWVAGNVEGFQHLLAPLLDKLAAKQAQQRPANAVGALTGKVAGAQVGVVLAFLGTKVLGQYEPFVDPPRLTLVAPNIVDAERSLEVDPHDFRLWVCLHESAHRTQFTAVPWMREHMEREIAGFIAAADLDPAQVSERLRAMVSAAARAARGGERASLLDVITTPEQRAALARLTALMTLLEGHAEYVMDEVGPEVVPSVAQIRERFNTKRRAGGGGVDRLLRKLLQLDLKMKQYLEGRKFVDEVVRLAGQDGFNIVWESPDHLPTTAEIADPKAWVTRVLAS
jgi:coenzyme F420 biosynthesis associated uncharacterized protein